MQFKYNFSKGHPNDSLLPTTEMQDLLKHVRVPTACLNYGADAGDEEFRDELARFLTRHAMDDVRGDGSHTAYKTTAAAVSPDHLFITSGVSHGIELLCAVLTRPGDTVLVESPTYFLVRDIFLSHGLKVGGLPVLNGRLDVDALKAECRMGRVPKLIYIIPTNQNPTGQTLSVELRQRLVEIACEFHIHCVADEVYHLLDWQEHRPARFTALSNSDYCISVSSFTKIFAPGVRCGWIEASKRVVDKVVKYGYIQSQGGCLPFMGHVMKFAVRSGAVDRVLSNLIVSYRERARLLTSILSTEPRIQIRTKPMGGFFLWIEFPFEAIQFLDYCQPDLHFMLGTRCTAVDIAPSSSSSTNLDNGARLCFAYLDLKDIEDGANLLIQKFRAYCLQAHGDLPKHGT